MAFKDDIRIPAKVSSARLIFDQSGTDRIIVDANGKMPLRVAQVKTAYDADGAVALTDDVVELDGSSEALAMTLADGYDGQEMSFVCTDATNNCVLTPANFGDGSTLTFDAVDEIAKLQFLNGSWRIIHNTATLA